MSPKALSAELVGLLPPKLESLSEQLCGLVCDAVRAAPQRASPIHLFPQPRLRGQNLILPPSLLRPGSVRHFQNSFVPTKHGGAVLWKFVSPSLLLYSNKSNTQNRKCRFPINKRENSLIKTSLLTLHSGPDSDNYFFLTTKDRCLEGTFYFQCRLFS